MSDWHFTFVEEKEEISPLTLRNHIMTGDPHHRSLAKANGELHFQRCVDSRWIVLSPMGMWISTDEYGESCRRLSDALQTRIIVMGGHTGLDGAIFGLFDQGTTIRALGAFDGQWCETRGTPQEWETAILGGIPEQDSGIHFNEGSLAAIAGHYELPPIRKINPGKTVTWTVDELILLSGPPPLPK